MVMTTQDPRAAEDRLSRLEGAYEQMDKRMADQTAATSALAAKVDALGAELRQELQAQISELRREIRADLRSLYLFVGGAWVSLAALVVGLYLAPQTGRVRAYPISSVRKAPRWSAAVSSNCRRTTCASGRRRSSDEAPMAR